MNDNYKNKTSRSKYYDKLLNFRDKFFNLRMLSPLEITEAEKVFENSIDFQRVRISETSLISDIGAFLHGVDGMGVSLFHIINFNRKLHVAPGNCDMAWLIHELTHVAQYECVGARYIPEAIYGQATKGYNYGGGAALIGCNFKDFNREQQAEIIKDFYRYREQILNNTFPFAAEYNRMQQQLLDGAL